MAVGEKIKSCPDEVALSFYNKHIEISKIKRLKKH